MTEKPPIPMIVTKQMAEMFTDNPKLRDLYMSVRDHAVQLMRTGHDPALVAMALASICSFILASEHDR